MTTLKQHIGDMIAAIADGATNADITNAILKEFERANRAGLFTVAAFTDHDLDDPTRRKQAPEGLADRDRKPAPVVDLDMRERGMGAAAYEPGTLDRIRQKSSQVESGMKSTQAMRDRIRELMTDPQDDYDRAVECVLDDLEGVLKQQLTDAQLKAGIAALRQAREKFGDSVTDFTLVYAAYFAVLEAATPADTSASVVGDEAARLIEGALRRAPKPGIPTFERRISELARTTADAIHALTSQRKADGGGGETIIRRDDESYS